MVTNPKFNLFDEVYFFDPEYEKGEEIFQAKIIGVKMNMYHNLSKPIYTYSLDFDKTLNEIEEEFLTKEKPLQKLKENIIHRTNQRILFLREDIKKLDNQLEAKKEYLALEKAKIYQILGGK